MPYQEPKKGEVFRRRLAIYLIGVAIGCVLLGIFKLGRPQQQPAPDPGAGQIQPTQPAQGSTAPQSPGQP